MTTAEDEKWRNRAQGYKRFVPDRGRTKLSEWQILLYALLHPFERPGESEDIQKDGEEDSSINSSRQSVQMLRRHYKAWVEQLHERSRKSGKRKKMTESKIAQHEVKQLTLYQPLYRANPSQLLAAIIRYIENKRDGEREKRYREQT